CPPRSAAPLLGRPGWNEPMMSRRHPRAGGDLSPQPPPLRGEGEQEVRQSGPPFPGREGGWGVRSASAVLALAALLGGAVSLLPGAGSDPKPAVRYVLLTPDTLPPELARLRAGALTRVPRDEFETLVRDAGGAADR